MQNMPYLEITKIVESSFVEDIHTQPPPHPWYLTLGTITRHLLKLLRAWGLVQLPIVWALDESLWNSNIELPEAQNPSSQLELLCEAYEANSVSFLNLKPILSSYQGYIHFNSVGVHGELTATLMIFALVTFAKSLSTLTMLHNEEWYPLSYETLDFCAQGGKIRRQQLVQIRR